MSYTKLVQFFATRADLEPGFRAVERQKRVCFVRGDCYYDNGQIPAIESFSSIPDLGKVSDRRSPRFLVLPANKSPTVKRVVQVGKRRDFPPKIAVGLAMVGIRPPGGKVVYEVSLGDHPSAITFAPGGLWNELTLVAGEIAAIHNTSASLELYRLFCRELLRGFTSVDSFKVGAEALALLKSGARLTIDVKAAPMLDLKMPA